MRHQDEAPPATSMLFGELSWLVVAACSAVGGRRLGNIDDGGARTGDCCSWRDGWCMLWGGNVMMDGWFRELMEDGKLSSL